MDFDKSKILTTVTADQAKAGDIGWITDTLSGIRTRVERGDAPKELEKVLPDDYTHRFKIENNAHTLFYPAPYEFLQAKWVEENRLQVGDKVRVTKSWEYNERGFRMPYVTHYLGAVGSVIGINDDNINIQAEKFQARVPYFAIEKVEEELEPKYRPFASAEEYKPHRGEYIQDRRSRCVYLPTGYNEGEVKMGEEWVGYSYLFEQCIFADTGEPAGVKV